MANKWATVQVGEIADSISVTHSRTKEKLVFLNTSDVLLGKVLHQTYSDVCNWPGQAKKSIRRDDILLSEIRPANGRWAYIDFDPTDFVVSTKLMVIRKKVDHVFPRFLYHFLTSAQTIEWLQHLAESRSGTFPQITFDQVAELQINLPPRGDQEAIARFLDCIDGKIELNRKQSETLEAMARTLFKAWFVDFEPVRAKLEGRWLRDQSLPGLPAHLYDLFPDRLVESELGEIPEGWNVSTLSAVCTYLNRGISPKYIDQGGVLVLNQKCIRDFSIDFSKARRHDVTQKKIDGRALELGDVVVNSTGVGTLGRVAQVRRLAETTIVDSHVTVVRSGPSINPMYLGGFMSMKQPEIEAMGEGSTGQTELSRTKLGELKILLPTDGVLDHFSKRTKTLSESIAANQEGSESLSQLRDTLLPKLISGELCVSDAERIIKDFSP